MSVPDRLQRALGEEEPIASTRLGGEDALVVTPTRSILYRAGGVLSEESITEFAHDAERISVSESRRKATITLEYGLEGEESFSVPSGKLEPVLKSLLAVNLSTTDAIGPEETVQAVFFFDELTLAVTDLQVLKHVGGAIWDRDYETIPFEAVTGLTFESGRINTQVVLETGTSAERIKTPQDRARAVRETLQDVLCDFHGVESVEALEETLAAAAPERENQDSVDAITLGTDFDLLEDETVTASATYDTEGETDDALAGLYDDRPAEGGSAGESTAAGGDRAAAAAEDSGSEEHPNAAGSGSNPERATGARATRVAESAATEGESNRAADAATSDDTGARYGGRSTAAGAGDVADSGARAGDVEALEDHVEELATVIDRQAELLATQQRTLERLREALENQRE